MELNSIADMLVLMAGIEADCKAVDLELDVLKLKESPLYLLLEEIAKKQKLEVMYERNILQKKDTLTKKCA